MNKKLLLFVICLLTISFANAQINTLALVGSGTPQDWPKDPQVDAAQLTSTDGENWTATNLTLLNGAVKFRANNSWDLPYNWGGTTFPSGTAIIDGAGITAQVGIYNVSFNSTTGVYSFEKQQSTFQVVSILGDATPGKWDVDTDMSTADGTIYSLKHVALVAGALKFRGDHSWTLPYNWGGTAFPSGTAVIDANGITIPSDGIYTITFNKTTFEYSFTFQVVSILGDATPGKWDIDTDMSTTDGITYTINNVSLVPGALKFRGDHSWTLPYNWGGTDFPSGTTVVDANGITIPTAGTYNISFNSSTGEYNFTDALGTTGFNAFAFNVYPNPTENNWNFSSLKETIQSIQIVDVLGKKIVTVFPKNNEVVIDASGFNTGIYFAKVATATSTNTIKLIKK